MSQLNEAIARYHRLLETGPHSDLGWADQLRQQMVDQKLVLNGRPISSVLRPHFITSRQYQTLVKAAEALQSAIARVESLALSTPALMARMQMLPAEKMLAQVDPGYSHFSVTSLLDTSLNNGTLRFVDYSTETPVGVAFGEALSGLFYDSAPMKEFRKKYSLTKLGGVKPLLQAVLKVYKEFRGKRQPPNIGIIEMRQPFQPAESTEQALLAEIFRREGYPAEVIAPDQLEYRNGVLRRGGFEIDLVFRRLRVSEFLMRFDLNHPLVRAYRDRAVCVVNSFRSELAQKKAIFDLLTDEALTAGFPAAERKTIRDYIPWTRVVVAAKTSYRDETVDLLEFILANRERLVLRPNDDSGENQTFRGAGTDPTAWERALKIAMRSPYVVQEVVADATFPFPVSLYGSLEFRDMRVEVQPHTYLGRVHGCSAWMQPAAAAGGYSSLAGLAPTFVIEPK